MIELFVDKIIKEIKLARGLLFKENCVLLVQDIRPGQGHFFLPGGNVDPGESVRAALPREWKEELGWDIKIGQFLGCLENRWNYHRKHDGVQVDVFEINFLFMTEVSDHAHHSDPVSKEPHLQFSWVPLDNLSSIHLLPAPLKTIIPNIANIRPSAIWSSTID